MNKINLAKALKLKNSIIRELNSLKSILARENSRLSTSTSTVDRESIWSQIREKTSHLVLLKSKITTANIGIYPVLAEMEETKSIISYIQTLNTQDGLEKTFDYHRNEVMNEYNAYIKRSQVDEMVASYQKTLENLQDQVDTYNATTQIEL